MKIAFLDRDGVINKDAGYTHTIEAFEFLEGVTGALIKLQKLGFKIIIVTNQSGIGRGLYSEDDYQQLTSWYKGKLMESGITVTDVLHCPHKPSDNCECRKPEPGLFLQADKKHSIDFQSSLMIGDRETDIEAAKRAGIKRQYQIRSNTNNALLECVLDNLTV